MSQKTLWIYGDHAVMHALSNPQRRLVRALSLTPENTQKIKTARPGLACQQVDKRVFLDLFGPQAVHQGICVETLPLPDVALETFCEKEKPQLLLVLDQVTDPHNVGAIVRSAAAFGVTAIIMQDRHSPDQLPLLAKTASGALEHVQLISVVNLSRALDYLKEQGYWIAGLDERGDPLGQKAPPFPLVLVLGAEGKGLRPLVKKTCDLHLRLPTSETFSTLNVSNAAAVALYACRAAMPQESA